MFMIVKRKHIASIIIIIAILTITGLLLKSSEENFSDESIPTTVSNSDSAENKDARPGEAVMVTSQKDFLIQARNDREIIRSKAIEIIKETLENESTSEKFRQDAESQILKMASYMDSEKKIETLLSAKGYDDNVVFISDDSVTVTVVKLLEETDIAKINDIVFEQTGNNNIKIVEVE